MTKKDVKAYLWIVVAMFLTAVVALPSILLYQISSVLPFLESILMWLIAFTTQWMATYGIICFIRAKLRELL